MGNEIEKECILNQHLLEIQRLEQMDDERRRIEIEKLINDNKLNLHQKQLEYLTEEAKKKHEESMLKLENQRLLDLKRLEMNIKGKKRKKRKKYFY